MKTFEIKGIGTATVVHPDGSTTVTKSNQILTSFADWAIDANLIDDVVARCKIGTGLSPNTQSTTELDTLYIPNGGFPSATLNANTVANLIDGGTYLQAEGNFSFVFPVGSIIASIVEYGLDFRSSTDESALVQTRVVLSPDDVINSINVGELDQLRIDYTLVIKAAVEQPVVPFEITRSDGSKTTHTAQLRWNPLRTINWYLQPLIMAPSEVNYTLQKHTQKPANFSAVPGVNITAYTSVTKGTLTKNQNVWTIPLSVPATAGNNPEGYNYLMLSVPYSIGGLPAGGWYIDPPLVKNDSQSFSLSLTQGG